MIGIYFSGTGNTAYCLKQFLMAYEGKAKMYSIEEAQVLDRIKESKDILFAHPIQYSNMPRLIHDFICDHKELWKGKNIYVMTTMGLFSGDGSGMTARLLKKYGANIIGGLHVPMPDSVADVKALKRPLEKNRETVAKSTKLIQNAAQKMKEGKPTQNGLSIGSHFLGLIGQRLYFYHKTKDYTDQLKINKGKCIGCGLCSKICPMQNISIADHKAVAGSKCTMCYRCISQCPNKAITLLGKEVVEQSRIEKYL